MVVAGCDCVPAAPGGVILATGGSVEDVDTAAGGFEMLTSGIVLVIGLAADFPCLPVAEQHTVTGQRSSDHDGQETTIERRTRLSCVAATRQQEGGDERGCFS
jgi:hypothetical protein